MMHWIDPACLSERRGRVSQFLINSHGDIDGMILDGRLQVHVPPHLGRTIGRYIKPGERISVRGLKPRHADVVAAVLVTTSSGRPILDEGPDHAAPERVQPTARPVETDGQIQQALYGPRGELRGALLKDGTSIRMPPHAAEALADYLQPEIHVRAWGHAIKTRYGMTIEVSDLAMLIDAPAS
jgi:hypothetical protein